MPTHYLQDGKTSCPIGSKYGAPENWPEGHTAVDQWDDTTCKACLATLRPPDYEELAPEHQWEIDKGLGILDWDGQFDSFLQAESRSPSGLSQSSLTTFSKKRR